MTEVTLSIGVSLGGRQLEVLDGLLLVLCDAGAFEITEAKIALTTGDSLRGRQLDSKYSTAFFSSFVTPMPCS